MSSLYDRIEYLRKGRAHHTWLGSIGIARDTIKNIKDKITPPSEKVLATIAKCENASFIWLTEGLGTPYNVARFESDESCADAMAEYFIDEPWTAYLVSSGHRHVFVLTLPSSFKRARSGFIEYTAIEILTHAGSKSIAEAAIHAGVFKQIALSNTDLDKLEQGQLGTYDLLGNDKKPGLLSEAQLIGMNQRLSEYAFSDTSHPPIKDVTDNHDDFQISDEERHLLGMFRELPDENKALVLTVMKKLT